MALQVYGILGVCNVCVYIAFVIVSNVVKE